MEISANFAFLTRLEELEEEIAKGREGLEGMLGMSMQCRPQSGFRAGGSRVADHIVAVLRLFYGIFEFGNVNFWCF